MSQVGETATPGLPAAAAGLFGALSVLQVSLLACLSFLSRRHTLFLSRHDVRSFGAYCCRHPAPVSVSRIGATFAASRLSLLVLCAGSAPFAVEIGVLTTTLVLSFALLAVRVAGQRAPLATKIAGRIALTVSLVLYPPAATSALRLVACTQTALAAPALAVLNGAPAALPPAGTTATVPILHSDPFYVCWAPGGAHLPAGTLAAVVIAAYVLGLPILLLLAAWADRRQRRGLPAFPRCWDLSRRRELLSDNPETALVAKVTQSTQGAEDLPADPFLAPLLADFVPRAWFFRHCELAVSLTLAAAQAAIPLPSTPLSAAVKAAVVITAVMALCSAILVVKPYPQDTAWKGPLKVLLLVLTALAAAVNLVAVRKCEPRITNYVVTRKPYYPSCRPYLSCGRETTGLPLLHLLSRELRIRF